MKTQQNVYTQDAWQSPLESNPEAQLVLAFGERDLASHKQIQTDLRQAYPNAQIIGCTTSGEIQDTQLIDSSLCITAITFKKTDIQVASTEINGRSIHDTAKELTESIDHDQVKYVLVLSDGQMVNGTELVDSLQTYLPNNTVITGGLAGDGTDFTETMVWHNDNVKSGQILICGLYGEDVQIGHGSVGGWDPFGPQRLITHSENNVLYSLDDKPALSLYKTYLGEHAKDLPSSALLFPLLITKEDSSDSVIRTILSVDEEKNATIFAGDIPQGAHAQLMRANFDRLIDGAESAAEDVLTSLKQISPPGVVLMISCVGRRLVLKHRTEEELEAVKEVIGTQHCYTGFYSYGEISPIMEGGPCALHNQTMTVTLITEKP